jgi:hypothetical protein
MANLKVIVEDHGDPPANWTFERWITRRAGHRLIAYAEGTLIKELNADVREHRRHLAEDVFARFPDVARTLQRELPDGDDVSLLAYARTYAAWLGALLDGGPLPERVQIVFLWYALALVTPNTPSGKSLVEYLDGYDCEVRMWAEGPAGQCELCLDIDMRPRPPAGIHYLAERP